MSDGDKKPGLKDISSLKARLGMLSKSKPTPAAPRPAPSVSASPFASPAPRPEADASGLELGADTAIVRIDAPIQQTPAPRPAVTKPPALSLGEDLFGGAAPTATTKAGPAQPRTAASKAAEQAAAEALFAAQDAAQKAAAVPDNVEFAHPLQVGAYVDAAPPVDLSAAEMEALESFEGQQRGVKTSFAATITVVVGLVLLAFGFFIGDVRSTRRGVNAQIDASMRVRDMLMPHLDRLREIEPVVGAMLKQPDDLDFARVDLLPADLEGVSPSVMTNPVPLDKDLTNMAGRAVVDLNMLFTQVQDHRFATLKRDRAELERLKAGDEFFTKYKQFAVYSVPPDPKAPPPAVARPSVGRLVALVGKKAEIGEDGQAWIPVRYRKANDDKNVLVRGLTVVDKTEFQASGGSNAMALYKKRVDGLRDTIKRIRIYEKGLREKLEEQANREKVFSF